MATREKMDRMANNAQDVIEAQRRSYEALTDSFIAFQKRNVRFIQSGFGGFGLQEDNLRAAQEWWKSDTDLAELQQRNAKFAQSWMNGGAEYLKDQAEHNQRAAEELAKSAREQQENLRKLGEDLVGIYQALLSNSRDYAEEGVKTAQQATQRGLQAVQETAEQADKVARQAGAQANGSGFPIADYDNLSVSEASQKLNGLSNEDLKKVRAYEKQNKDRDSLLDQIDRKMKSASA